jgi:hypothetical protein
VCAVTVLRYAFLWQEETDSLEVRAVLPSFVAFRVLRWIIEYAALYWQLGGACSLTKLCRFSYPQVDY